MASASSSPRKRPLSAFAADTPATTSSQDAIDIAQEESVEQLGSLSLDEQGGAGEQLVIVTPVTLKDPVAVMDDSNTIAAEPSSSDDEDDKENEAARETPQKKRRSDALTNFQKRNKSRQKWWKRTCAHVARGAVKYDTDFISIAMRARPHSRDLDKGRYYVFNAVPDDAGGLAEDLPTYFESMEWMLEDLQHRDEAVQKKQAREQDTLMQCDLVARAHVPLAEQRQVAVLPADAGVAGASMEAETGVVTVLHEARLELSLRQCRFVAAGEGKAHLCTRGARVLMKVRDFARTVQVTMVDVSTIVGVKIGDELEQVGALLITGGVEQVVQLGTSASMHLDLTFILQLDPSCDYGDVI